MLRRRLWKTVCWPVQVSGSGARTPVPQPPARARTRSRPRSRGRPSSPGGRGGPPRRSAGGTLGHPRGGGLGGERPLPYRRPPAPRGVLRPVPLAAPACRTPSCQGSRRSPVHQPYVRRPLRDTRSTIIPALPWNATSRLPRHRPTGLVRAAAAKAKRRRRAGSAARPAQSRAVAQRPDGPIPIRLRGPSSSAWVALGWSWAPAVSSARRTTRVSWPCSSTTWAGTRARPT